MSTKQMRDEINSITRWIAYTVYSSAGGRHRFSKAYERLYGRVFLDHNISIDNLAVSSKGEANNIFDVLDNDELVKVLASAQSLQRMYNDVMGFDYV